LTDKIFIKKLISFFLKKHNKIRKIFVLFYLWIYRQIEKKRYNLWIKKYEPDSKTLFKQKSQALDQKIVFSIIILSSQQEADKKQIRSIVEQTFNKYEIHFFPFDKWSSVSKEFIKSQMKGSYIFFLSERVFLTPFAFFTLFQVIKKDLKSCFFYFDQDEIKGNKRKSPFFKPEYAPDYLVQRNYFGEMLLLKKDWFLEKYDQILNKKNEGFFYELALKFGEQSKRISSLLYHISRKDKLLDKKITQINQKVVSEYLINSPYKPFFLKTTLPKVSILIPNKDQKKLLKKCIDSILKKTTYPNYEILILENNSLAKSIFDYYDSLKTNKNIKIVQWEQKYNYSAINNHGAKFTEGEILLFLNNDTEVISPDWIERMLEYALRSNTGSVGAKLYYENNTVQHAGIVYGNPKGVLHIHREFSQNSKGYFDRLQTVQNYNAVTGACLMMRKSVFNEVGGFDEQFEIAFNDVDLCFKLREKGYLVVWTPHAELYHREMATRGKDEKPEKRERFLKEFQRYKIKWRAKLEKVDEYYNPNLRMDKEYFWINF